MLQLTPAHSLALVGILYAVGALLLHFFPALTRINLAASVLGGFFGGLVLWFLYGVFDLTVQPENTLRDILLVIYFATIGCTTNLQQLRRGGRPLIILSVLAILLILSQNLLGVLLAKAVGVAPGYGLLSGSIPFVGGFGSSAAWSKEFSARGLTRALDVSITCSTLGLILGGFFSGPLVAFLMRRHGLKSAAAPAHAPQLSAAAKTHPISAERVLYSIALVAGSIYLGDLAQGSLHNFNIVLPRFLTAMLSGVALANLTRPHFRHHLDDSHELVGDVALHTFIVLVLSGMQIWSLATLVGPLFVVALLQSLLTVLFCWRILFPLMGRDYEAAIMAGATVGYGLSSFAVAMATVKVTVKNHGPAPRALLLMPLAGAAVVDLSNNLIISGLFQFRWFFSP